MLSLHTATDNEIFRILSLYKKITEHAQWVLQEKFRPQLQVHYRPSRWSLNPEQAREQAEFIRELNALSQQKPDQLPAVFSWLNEFLLLKSKYQTWLQKHERGPDAFLELLEYKKIDSLRLEATLLITKKNHINTTMLHLYRSLIAQIKEEYNTADKMRHYTKYHDEKLQSLISQIKEIYRKKLLSGKLLITSDDISTLLDDCERDAEFSPEVIQIWRKELNDIHEEIIPRQDALNDLYLQVYSQKIGNAFVKDLYESVTQAATKEMDNCACQPNLSPQEIRRRSTKAKIQKLNTLIHEVLLAQLETDFLDEKIFADVMNMHPKNKLRYFMFYHLLKDFSDNLKFEQHEVFSQYYFTEKNALSSLIPNEAQKRLNWFECCYYEREGHEDPFGTAAFADQLIELLSAQEFNFEQLIKKIDHIFNKFLDVQHNKKLRDNFESYYKQSFINQWQNRMKKLKEELKRQLNIANRICANEPQAFEITQQRELDFIAIKHTIQKLFNLKIIEEKSQKCLLAKHPHTTFQKAQEVKLTSVKPRSAFKYSYF